MNASVAAACRRSPPTRDQPTASPARPESNSRGTHARCWLRESGARLSWWRHAQPASSDIFTISKNTVAGFATAIAALSPGALEDFARAIMTTDTHPKIASARLKLDGAEVTVAGCAKGAGMIEPKMATMLAFIVTDAAVATPELKRTLTRALPESFNAITVDGDMSTNDTRCS